MELRLRECYWAMSLEAISEEDLLFLTLRVITMFRWVK